MTSKCCYIPSDLAEHTLRLYAHFGLDVVGRRDGEGNSLEIEVPYDMGQGQMCSYKISRQPINVKMRGLGTRSRRCTVSKKERRQLLALFQEIDKIKIQSDMAQKGPHQLRICT